MTSLIRPWPYAAKAVVQYEHTATTLQLWVIFRHPMDQIVKPPLSKWIVKVNTVPKTPAASAWLDAWTLTLFVANIPAHPTTVTLEYDGPDEGLRTTWTKQWEPWGPIDAGDVPFEWEHILDVDVPNARVTINGMLLLSSLDIYDGVHKDLSVTGVNIIRLDSVAGNTIIEGFAMGIKGQILYFVILRHGGNDIKIVHEDISAAQKIHLHAGADETLTNEYGGWVFYCTGYEWFDISHAKHV